MYPRRNTEPHDLGARWMIMWFAYLLCAVCELVAAPLIIVAAAVARAFEGKR